MALLNLGPRRLGSLRRSKVCTKKSRRSVSSHHHRRHTGAKRRRCLSLGGLRVLGGGSGVLSTVGLLLGVLLRSLGLDVLVVDGHGLVDLGAESLLVLEPVRVDQLGTTAWVIKDRASDSEVRQECSDNRAIASSRRTLEPYGAVTFERVPAPLVGRL